MKIFVVKILIFTSLWGIFLTGNFLINQNLIKKEQLPCSEGATTFLMGDSHIMTDILPDEANGRFNLGNHGEPYYLTYLKARKLLNTCKSPQKTLFLGIGPQNFSDFNEIKLQIPRYAKTIYQDYYPLLLESPAFFDRLGMKYNKRMYYKTIIKTMCLYPHKKHRAWLGHFDGRPYRLSVAQLDKTIKRHYYAESNTLCHISQIAVRTLDSLIDLSQKKKVRLVLLALPLHSKYRQAIPKRFEKHFQNTLASCRQKGIEVLDYSRLNLPDSLFYDYDHLNKKGAALFTQMIEKDLGWK